MSTTIPPEDRGGVAIDAKLGGRPSISVRRSGQLGGKLSAERHRQLRRHLMARPWCGSIAVRPCFYAGLLV